jgi:hypothetical protein
MDPPSAAGAPGAATAEQLNADGAPGPAARRTPIPLYKLYGPLKALAKRTAESMGELAEIDPLSIAGTCSERPLPPFGLLAAPAVGPDPRLGFDAEDGVDLAGLSEVVQSDGGWPETRGVGAAVEPADWERLCTENAWPYRPGWGLADGGSRTVVVSRLRAEGLIPEDARGPFVVLKPGLSAAELVRARPPPRGPRGVHRKSEGGRPAVRVPPLRCTLPPRPAGAAVT